MDDLTNSTTMTGNSATSETSPDSGNVTVQTNGDAGQMSEGQGAPIEEAFTKVDVRTLPPQLRESYNNMLTDYKKKTSEVSERVKSEVAKATESLRSKAEYYDSIVGQEEFVKQWNEYVQKVNQVETQNPGTSQTNPELMQIKAQLQEVSQKLQERELSQVTDAFAEAVNEKGEKINVNFDKFNNFSMGHIKNGNEAEDFSFLRACVELAPGGSPEEKLANGYKKAEELYSSIFEEGRKAGMGRVQSKVLNGSQPPTNVGGALSMTEKKPKSAREALEMAKKGIIVSR